MYHASSSADENINMSMGLGGQDGGNGMFNDASSTEADGEFILLIFLRKGTKNFLKLSQPFFLKCRLSCSINNCISKRYTGIMLKQQIKSTDTCNF